MLVDVFGNLLKGSLNFRLMVSPCFITVHRWIFLVLVTSISEGCVLYLKVVLTYILLKETRYSGNCCEFS